MSRLQDRIAIVTGGSRGIGRAIAIELAREGASVVVNYRTRQDEADGVVAEIEGMGRQAIACQADVTDQQAMRRLAGATVQQFGRIDVLVANAGIVRDQLAAAMSLDDWSAVINTNLSGTFLAIREVIPQMMSQKRGSIVAISSIAADRAGRGHCNYVAAKGGINAMTRALAVELAPKKIRVNAVAPGVVATEMSNRVRNLAGDEILAQIPLRRYGEPIDIARAVCFLASDDASYITGEILHVTGGFGL